MLESESASTGVLQRVAARESDALAVAPWLLIPYESLTYLVGLDPGETSQTFPATAVFSVVYLVLRGSKLRMSDRSRLVFMTMATAALIMAIVTALNIALEQSGVFRPDSILLRFPNAVRQGLSMLLGLTTLLMFQDSLLRAGLPACMRWTVIGGIPSLALAAIQFLSGEFRVQGFSSEPSLVADMLVFAFLPACAASSLNLRLRWVGAVSGTIALLLTFSTTGFMKASFAGLAYFVERRQLAKGLIVIGVFLTLVYVVLTWFPQNYAVLVYSYMSQEYDRTGQLVTGSFIDRFYGLVGPVSLMDQPRAWLGFGFGGDTVYFDSLFTDDTALAILGTKPGAPSISSLQGKMWMYGGGIGYAWYLAAWLRAWRGTPPHHLSRVMLPAVFMSSLFSLGPMFLPYPWIWLAAASTAVWRE